MSLLLSTRRTVLLGAVAWTPASPTGGGYTPEHWYRVELGKVWQDAGSTPAASAGDVIGRLEDQATSADHVNQGTTANKPTLQAGPNGTLVARSDGIDDYLQGAFTNGGQMNQPNTVFAVAKLNAGKVNDNFNDWLLDSDDITNRMGVASSTTPNPDEWAIYAGAWLRGNAVDSDWNIWTVVFNGVSSRFWHNGIAETAAGDAGAHNPDGITILASYNAAGIGHYDVSEIILYDANLPDADKNQVGQYLAARYGLTYTDI